MMILLVAAEAAGDAPSVTDWLTAAVAVAALVASTLALWYNHRSAKAAEVSAQVAQDSAAAAKTSADAAERVAQAELDRDHEMYRPGDPEPRFVWEDSSLHKDRLNLFFEYTPVRGYRAAGKPSFGPGKGHGSMSVPQVFPAGETQRIYVDDVAKSKPDLQVKMLELEFWPAQEGDPGELWICRCGRGTHPDGEAHWVWNVPVTAPPMPLEPLIAWV
jgi:hypothetical protein